MTAKEALAAEMEAQEELATVEEEGLGAVMVGMEELTEGLGWLAMAVLVAMAAKAAWLMSQPFLCVAFLSCKYF